MAGQPQPVSVVLEVSERRPPAGWLLTGEGVRTPFGGWLELIGLLETILDEPADGQEPRGAS
jgi:hypothetical protein